LGTKKQPEPGTSSWKVDMLELYKKLFKLTWRDDRAQLQVGTRTTTGCPGVLSHSPDASSLFRTTRGKYSIFYIHVYTCTNFLRPKYVYAGLAPPETKSSNHESSILLILLLRNVIRLKVCRNRSYRNNFRDLDRRLTFFEFSEFPQAVYQRVILKE
jgi:hypothetical protein